MVIEQLRARSVGAKVVWLVTLASTLAVVLACVVMLAQILLQLRGTTHRFIMSDAQVFAIHLAAPLAFNDAPAAEETLNAFRIVPNLLEARLYDVNGELFANYQKVEGAPLVTFSTKAGVVSEAGFLKVNQPVVHDGEALGTLVMAYDMAFVYRQLGIATGLAVVIAAGAIAVAVLVAFRLRSTITQPVNELMATARTISDHQDYSARARKISNDEFGELTDAFNAMLERIREQDKAIRDTNDDLRASNQEMEQFVYTVSHDLKSPLVTIAGFVGLLREDLLAQRDEDVHDSLEHLEKAARKMGMLIEDLLNLSRVGRMEYHMAWVDPREVVEEVLQSLDMMVEEKKAQVQIDPQLPLVWGDRQRLSQLFQNLIENALKYGCPEAGQCVSVGGHREKDHIELYVRDRGPGIDPEYHERVFGLFQRLAPAETPGTGIGLTIARRIAEAHDGSIRIESSPGEGCTFHVRLPLPIDQPKPQTASAPASVRK